MRERINYAKQIWECNYLGNSKFGKIFGMLVVLFGKFDEDIGYNADQELVYIDFHSPAHWEYGGEAWTTIVRKGFRWGMYDDSTV